MRSGLFECYIWNFVFLEKSKKNWKIIGREIRKCVVLMREVGALVLLKFVDKGNSIGIWVPLYHQKS